MAGCFRIIPTCTGGRLFPYHSYMYGWPVVSVSSLHVRLAGCFRIIPTCMVGRLFPYHPYMYGWPVVSTSSLHVWVACCFRIIPTCMGGLLFPYHPIYEPLLWFRWYMTITCYKLCNTCNHWLFAWTLSCMLCVCVCVCAKYTYACY